MQTEKFKILKISKLPDNFVAQDSRYSYMKEVTVEEIYAFIGLCLYRGLYKLNISISYFLLTLVLQ